VPRTNVRKNNHYTPAHPHRGFVTLLKYPLKHGGIKIEIPETIETLLTRGGNRLGLTGARQPTRVRDTNLGEINDVGMLTDGDLIYLMTNLDEKRMRIFN